MINLRDYQQDLYNATFEKWSLGFKNVLAVSATGSGKTVLMSKIVHDFGGSIVVIAHRAELVKQISTTLARANVRHNIIASKNTVADSVDSHLRNVRASYFDPSSKVTVASVDTLIKRESSMKSVFAKVGLWLIDEAHHVLSENKWGTASRMFPNAKGLGVSATPERADGKGLGSHNDGVFDTMVEGKPMRWLIEQGFLTDYKIYAPPSDIDIASLRITASGDYNHVDLKTASKKSHIIGDVVSHYKKLANGSQTVVFATDVETADEIANRFNQEGVAAACVHGGTHDNIRSEQIRKFETKQLQVLVNVDAWLVSQIL